MSDLPRLVASGIGKTWTVGRRRIAIDVDALTLRAGEVKAMVGPSGSGKSTALDMLALVLSPDRLGRLRVSVDGETLLDADAAALRRDSERLTSLRRRAFAYVVQTHELMPFLRLRQNFALQQRISGRGTAALATELAERLGIGECLDSYPDALSVGQRQRAAVVRALACRPPLLLADEPTSALDPDLKDAVLAEFLRIAAEGTAVLIVTHDHHLVERHGLTAIGVESGKSGDDWQTRFSDALAA